MNIDKYCLEGFPGDGVFPRASPHRGERARWAGGGEARRSNRLLGEATRVVRRLAPDARQRQWQGTFPRALAPGGGGGELCEVVAFFILFSIFGF